MCSARRLGRTAAAPPAEMQHHSRRRPGRSNQSGPADMLTVKHAKALKPSILILVTPTFIQVFVKLPCSCSRAALVIWYMASLINSKTSTLKFCKDKGIISKELH